MASTLTDSQKTLESCSAVISDEPQRYFKSLTFSNFITTKLKEFKDNIFIRSRSEDGQTKLMTYGQVDNFTSKLACCLYNDIKAKYGIQLGKDVTVAIFNTHCVSSFLLIVALIKIKCKMLMISPRNSPEAVKSLIEKTKCCLCFAGPLFVDSVSSVPAALFPCSRYYELLNQPDGMSEKEIAFMEKFNSHQQEELNDIVAIIHSSGTTAFPKAIQLSNRYMLFLAQAFTPNFSARGYHRLCLKETSQVICLFPIFHVGGIGSAFRAIAYGGSNIYLHQYPPSINELMDCIREGQEMMCQIPLPLIEKLIAHVTQTNEVGLLRDKINFMETGGNPIPLHIVDWFKDRELKLGVAYASSESLPMMTNNYLLDSIEHDILFLMPSLKPYVFMEPFDSERFQLIIKASSPYTATGIANRDNGDYATKDLFYKSKYIDGFYYSGRADDILLMSNGEKTNPVPMELAIKECPFVLNCLVIGQSKPCTALLFEIDSDRATGHSLEEIMNSVNKYVDIANQNAPNFSTILPQMIAQLPSNQCFPTTDKGSISRTKTLVAFSDIIEELYDNLLHKEVVAKNVDFMIEDEVKQKLHNMVTQLLGTSSVRHEDSLFNQGLNSLTAIQLRNKIMEEIKPVPQEFVYSNDTICNMTIALIEKEVPQKDSLADTEAILKDFVKRASIDINYEKKHTVLLTGATGSLGTYLLRDLILDLEHIKKVYVLVRQSDYKTPRERVLDSLQRRKIDLDIISDPNRVEILCIDSKDKTYLGLESKGCYDQLRSEVTLIQACGWMLDFYKTVKHYEKDCLDDFYRLIQFAHQEQQNPIPLHFISSISASTLYGPVVPEVPMPSDSPQVALPFGYGQSKFIAEKLLDYLREEKNMPCYIHRVGQVCGDSVHGTWNTSELVSSILMGGVLDLKQMPDLEGQINWIPVDYAAKTIHQLMIRSNEMDCKQTQHIFHILHPHATSWKLLIQNIRESGLQFDIVPLETWTKSVERKGESNPAFKFIDLLKMQKGAFSGSNTTYEITQTSKIAPVLLDTPELNANQVIKWFQN
ncbi:hypothetical protein BD560DRAFT_488260 [Blakeslea trispora]|nr:hypothetical protein BD560DRAFT_488260 [Blakeslea trispora]